MKLVDSAESSPALLDQAAVVTGSSSGIGRAIALELARRGADVLIHARRSADQAHDVARQIQELGRDATVVIADVSVADEREKLISASIAWRDIHI